jgi:protein-L-isoaspartate(D-aspartate) O-methyltransferase
MNKNIKSMLDTIRMETEYSAPYTGRSKLDERVLKALEEVDRVEFVPKYYRQNAYDNGPLPIGHGQTISQPFIVALMTDLLDLKEDDIVLEVGTGSGYQSAVISKLVRHVYSVERISELAESSAERLKELGISNVDVRCVNGYFGWAEMGPFDAIIVTAAASHIPESLVEQLKPGGRMIIPVGLPYMHQELMLVTKDKQGETEIKSVLGVAFVPLVNDSSENGMGKDK